MKELLAVIIALVIVTVICYCVIPKDVLNKKLEPAKDNYPFDQIQQTIIITS